MPPEHVEQNDSADFDLPRQPRIRIPKSNKRWLAAALGIGAIIVLASVVLSLMFAGATVTVYPKQDTVVVNASLVAAKDGAQGALPFERVVFEKTLQEDVVALGEEEVEERARGIVTIYNEFSESPQRLIKRTRFESTDGRIYRIQNAVELPGMQADGTPGKIQAEVVAESAGEEFNIPGAMEFSVPGLSGLPQEELIYARSSDAITGGFVGVRRSIDEGDRQATLDSLETRLRDELLSEAFSENGMPEGYQLSKNAVFFEFEPLPDELTGVDTVTLRLTGKLHGVLFPSDAFAQRIAQLTLSTYTNSPIRIDNPADLSVSLVATNDDGEADNDVALWDASRYTVTVQGKARFIWEFDDAALAGDLAGKDEEMLNMPKAGGLLDGYPGIDRLEASIRPFWRGTFPEEVGDIVVITKLDE
jgi:hypothetical protein